MKKIDILIVTLIVILTTITVWNSRDIILPYIRDQSSPSNCINCTFFGGSRSDQIRDIAVDSEGNIIIVGGTYSLDFPVKNANQARYSNDVTSDELWFTDEAWYWQMGDAFVAKLDPCLTLEWSTYLGGCNNDIAYQVLVDSEDNIIVFGQTMSLDFPVTDSTSLSNDENGDSFITRFTPRGEVIDSTYYYTYIKDAKKTPSGNILIAGETASTQYYCTDDAFQTSIKGETDGYIRELTEDFTMVIYSSLLGGSKADAINKVFTDETGNIYAIGYTDSSNLPTTDNASWPNLCGAYDGFIMKLNANKQYEYITYFGGLEQDDIFGLTSNHEGVVSIVGRTRSPDFPITGDWLHSEQNNLDVQSYLSMFNQNGELQQSSYFGLNNWDTLININTDAHKKTVITGFVLSGGFETINPVQLSFNGENDIILIIEGDETELFTYLGGGSTEHPFAQCINNGKIYVVGVTASQDFPISKNAFQPEYNGNEDGFIWIIDYFTYLNE